MSILVIWFVALVTVIGSSNTVEISPAQALDLNKVLGLVKQLRLNNPSEQRILRLRVGSSDSNSDSDFTSDSTPDSSSDSSDDSNRIETKRRKVKLLNLLINSSISKGKINSDGKLVRSGDNNRLAKERIIDLIETVSANEKKKNDRISNRKGKPSRGRNSYLFRSENHDTRNNNVQDQILEKLFSQTSNVEERPLKPKKKLIPNPLTPTFTMNDVMKYYGDKNKNDEVTGLEEYSKVYIVLNPQAVKNSKNKNALNDLISKVLSLSSQTPKGEPQEIDPFRYKGFAVKPSNGKRRVMEINDNIARMGDDEEKLDPPAASLGRITAAPK